jgi:hypothetical protein
MRAQHAFTKASLQAITELQQLHALGAHRDVDAAQALHAAVAPVLHGVLEGYVRTIKGAWDASTPISHSAAPQVAAAPHSAVTDASASRIGAAASSLAPPMPSNPQQQHTLGQPDPVMPAPSMCAASSPHASALPAYLGPPEGATRPAAGARGGVFSRLRSAREPSGFNPPGGRIDANGAGTTSISVAAPTDAPSKLAVYTPPPLSPAPDAKRVRHAPQGTVSLAISNSIAVSLTGLQPLPVHPEPKHGTDPGSNLAAAADADDPVAALSDSQLQRAGLTRAEASTPEGMARLAEWLTQGAAAFALRRS